MLHFPPYVSMEQHNRFPTKRTFKSQPNLISLVQLEMLFKLYFFPDSLVTDHNLDQCPSSVAITGFRLNYGLPPSL